MNNIVKRAVSLGLVGALSVSTITVPVKAEETAPAYDSVEGQATVEAIADAIEHMDSGADFAAWGASQLFKELFKNSPMPGTKSEAEQIQEILSHIKTIEGQLSVIENEVKDTPAAVLINEYRVLDQDGDTADILEELQNCDNNSKTAADKENFRKKLFLYQMTGTNEGSEIQDLVDYEYDKFYEKYKAYVLGTFTNVSAQDMTMIEMYDLMLRHSKKWYNSYCPQKVGFQNYVMGKYYTVAALEKLSLLARAQTYEKSHPSGEAVAIRQRIKSINKDMDEARKLFKKCKAFQPEENKRYYMYPGNEMVIYATAKEQIIPKESRSDIGLFNEADWVKAGYPGDSPLAGIYMKSNFDCYPRLEFWRGFISYGTNILCPTATWMETVYQDYGGKVSLYDIFFSKENADMTAPSGSDSNWYFMLDPENTHPMKYVKNTTKADYMTTPVITSKGDTKYNVIYNYHNTSNNPETSNKYIGIGIIGKPEEKHDIGEPAEKEDVVGAAPEEVIDYDTYKSELPSHTVLTIDTKDASNYVDMKIHTLDATTAANQELLVGYYALLTGKKSHIISSYAIYPRNDISAAGNGKKMILTWNDLPYKSKGVIFAVCYNQTDKAYLLKGTVTDQGMAVFDDFILRDATNITIFTME